MSGVLCVGTATQDFVFGLETLPLRAEKHFAHAFASVGGGMAANAAVAIARLGGKASLAMRLGDDGLGRDIIQGLEREGVDCTFAHCVPGAQSPLSAIMVDAAGERMVINYTDDALLPDTAWLPTSLPGNMACVLADTRWEEGSLHCLTLARKAGAFAVLDLDRAPRNERLMQGATHIACSAPAARDMTGIQDVAQALQVLASRFTAWVAVTDGARGTYIAGQYRNQISFQHEPAFTVKAVDTLGAGDVFHGALALGLAEGMEEGHAVRFASAAAAIKCTRFGGRAGTPSRQETEKLMREVA